MPETISFMVSPSDFSVLKRVMTVDEWDHRMVIEASLEAFKVLLCFAGNQELPVPQWVPAMPCFNDSKPYWEADMGREEKNVSFWGLELKSDSFLWKELSSLSEQSFPSLRHVPYSKDEGPGAHWTMEEVLWGGAAMLARGLRQTSAGARLAVSLNREGFGHEMILNSRLFPDSVRVGSLLSE